MDDPPYVIESRFRDVGHIASEAFDLMAKRSSDASIGNGLRSHVPTGFYAIDKLIRGFYPGELAIVTGTTGVGKSALALNLASKAALSGTSTLLVSLEIDSATAFMRICAADARVGVDKILAGKLSENDWASIADASLRLGESRLRICDDVHLTSEDLGAEVETLLGGTDTALIVFDGVEVANDFVNGYASPMPIRERAIALKRLARCGRVPVVSTMGYGPGFRGKVSDHDGALKALPSGVGGISDTIIHIGKNPTSKDHSQGVVDVLVAKNGTCAPARAKLAFAPQYLRFMDYAEA